MIELAERLGHDAAAVWVGRGQSRKRPKLQSPPGGGLVEWFSVFLRAGIVTKPLMLPVSIGHCGHLPDKWLCRIAPSQAMATAANCECRQKLAMNYPSLARAGD
ncbi:hypothetical protein [Chitinimonas sp.]|uniref:hypothetical protein n=1 Tax=Chitinimonas sp. TaxID=1934313 RepID=UPI0035B42B43